MESSREKDLPRYQNDGQETSEEELVVIRFRIMPYSSCLKQVTSDINESGPTASECRVRDRLRSYGATESARATESYLVELGNRISFQTSRGAILRMRFGSGLDIFERRRTALLDGARRNRREIYGEMLWRRT